MKAKTLVIASLATIIVVTIGLVSAEYNSNESIPDNIIQENCNGNRNCNGICERANNCTENCNNDCQNELKEDCVGCTGEGYGICKATRERGCSLRDGTGHGSKGCCRN